jgi:hypothetical protein
MFLNNSFHTFLRYGVIVLNSHVTTVYAEFMGALFAAWYTRTCCLTIQSPHVCHMQTIFHALE